MKPTASLLKHAAKQVSSSRLRHKIPPFARRKRSNKKQNTRLLDPHLSRQNKSPFPKSLFDPHLSLSGCLLLSCWEKRRISACNIRFGAPRRMTGAWNTAWPHSGRKEPIFFGSLSNCVVFGVRGSSSPITTSKGRGYAHAPTCTPYSVYSIFFCHI